MSTKDLILFAFLAFLVFLCFATGLAAFVNGMRKQIRARRVKRPAEPVNAPVSPGWSEHDAQTLRGYLTSETGRRFILRLQATEYDVSVRNATDVMHTAHSAGITVGYGQCLRHVQSLANCGQKAERAEAVPTEEDVLAELERRYSP